MSRFLWPSGIYPGVTELIARLIAQRVKCRVEDVLGWMDKNKKFTAEDCLKLSLCDAIV